MKKLIICRHSHAEASHKNGDFYRKLDKDGIDMAKEMGKRLKERDIVPQLVISSPAARAQQTAEIITGALGFSADGIVTDACLYEQNVYGVISLIKNCGGDAENIMLFGHVPSVRILAAMLSGDNEQHTPVCSATAIEFEGDCWESAFDQAGEIIFRELI